MNHLAHATIAGSYDLFMLGQLLGDFATSEAMKNSACSLKRGVDAHRALDRFTDAHPAFIRGVRILESGCSRYAPVVMDVWIDHVLAKHWNTLRSGSENYPSFASKLYDSILLNADALPERLRLPALRMHHYRGLSGYASSEGLNLILDRIAQRVRIPEWIHNAKPVLCRDCNRLEETALELLIDPQLERFNSRLY